MWTFWLLAGGMALALPPEGFENFAMLAKGKPGGTSIAMAGAYDNPAWRTDYQSGEFVGGWGTSGGNYFSFGSRATLSPKFGDKDAYFLRFDWILWDTSSLAFKAIHENWGYIPAGKESIGMEYNFFVPMGASTGFYMTLGLHYRWLKNYWDTPWWGLSTHTTDQEGYVHAVMGWKLGLGASSFTTFDINTRDTYSYYNLDNIAFDLGINLMAGTNFLWRIALSARTAALFMGTAAVSNYHASLGFIVF